MKKITILLDAGHGESTPGKRSPKEGSNPQFFEYIFNRNLSNAIKAKCDQLGIKCIQTNIDNTDPSLTTRANIVNQTCKEEEKLGNSCLLISLHANAAGNGTQWSNATGWEVFTSVGTTKSDIFANILCNIFPSIFPDKVLRGRKEKNYTILVKTLCPAVLTENFFYDSKIDLQYITSNEGFNKIVDLHIKAIKTYLDYE